MTEFQNKYFDLLKSQYPSCSPLFSRENLIDNLISSHVLRLPKDIYDRVTLAVKSIYNYSRTEKHLQHIISSASPSELEILNHKPVNTSVLMAYDFHYDLNSQLLSLIEINTNASAFLLADLLYKVEPQNGAPWGNSLSHLQESFAKEFSSKKQSRQVAIVDANVPQQKMYIEFLMYLDFFKKMNLSARIFEFDELPIDQFHLVYNRHTDFLLSQSESQKLRKAYLENKIILSPNPKEYLLLALKDRLIDFYSANASDVLIPTVHLKNSQLKENAWARRKSLFFKPRNSFGAKAAYRGSSISRKTFDQNIDENFIAQEYRPPGEIDGYKFDLRFYVYESQIQLAVARMYKGQVTNFSHPGGGLARVQFI